MTLRALRDAFGYFSVLPVGTTAPLDPDALGYLPLVGAATGALAGTLALAVDAVAPHPLAVAVAFAAPIVLTGAIHIDGFLDASDALCAAVSPERRREIMRDPHVGSFAVTAFALVTVTSLSALASLPAPAYPFALAFAGAVGRTSALLNAYVLPYPVSGSSVHAFTRPPAVVPIVLATLGGLASGIAIDGRAGWLAAGVIATGLAGGRVCSRRLGSRLGGDAYGFLTVACETLALAGLALLAGA